ncbi:MAG: hypothetical protein HY426_02685 [Candidatus Levybacteria bacterium]|nr:hypothetical protein [Candidatus Levybacteria bacterium]
MNESGHDDGVQSPDKPITDEAPLSPDLISATSSRDLYVKILGRETFPKTPDDLPDFVILPAGLLAPLKGVMPETDSGGKEQGGYLKWDPVSKLLRGRRMRLSTRSHVVWSAGALNPGFLGQKPSIAIWHSHPNGLYTPSNQDILTANRWSNSSFIFLTGAGDGISALLRTEEGQKPLDRSSAISIRKSKELFPDLPKIAENAGFGFYVLAPELEVNSNTRSFKRIRPGGITGMMDQLIDSSGNVVAPTRKYLKHLRRVEEFKRRKLQENS